MPIKVLMPALSPTMTEGNLAKWHKNVGDPVEPGDVIAEIETDKATMEVEAVDEGKLGKILVPEGAQGVKVNEVIALMLEEGEDEAALAEAEKEAKAKKAGDGAEAPSREAEKAEAPKVEPEAPKAEAPPPQEAPPPAETRAAQAPPPVRPEPAEAPHDRVFASPLARRMAREAGIDLSAVHGSGPRGRIVKADIETALRRGVAPPMPAEAPAGPAEYEVVPLTAMRRIVAQRMSESKQTAPHFYLTIDCEIDRLLELRREINGRLEDHKVSVNDLLIRAAALALLKVPEANAAWSDEGIRMYKAADISVAVALPQGLITPVVRAADRKTVVQISREAKSLIERARAGKLTPEEYQGGTFSLSNLGMYGIKHFEAVINPPQGCILAVGAGEQRPVVKDGEITIATVMSCTLSVDHRSVDGATGARYLAEFKSLVQDPISLLL